MLAERALRVPPVATRQTLTYDRDWRGVRTILCGKDSPCDHRHLQSSKIVVGGHRPLHVHFLVLFCDVTGNRDVPALAISRQYRIVSRTYRRHRGQFTETI